MDQVGPGQGGQDGFGSDFLEQHRALVAQVGQALAPLHWLGQALGPVVPVMRLRTHVRYHRHARWLEARLGVRAELKLSQF